MDRTSTVVGDSALPTVENGLPGWEMPLIHRIIRRGLSEARQLVGDVPPESTERADAVATHLAFVLDGLHVHHSTEDELLWPLLRQRTAFGSVLERMEVEHTQLGPLIDGVRRESQAWATQPSAPASEALAASLDALHAELDTHLDEEEHQILHLIAEHVTHAEWATFGQQAFEKFEPRQRPIAMGQLLEVATPPEAAAMFATLPAPVRLLWRLTGRRTYDRYTRRFRGKRENRLLHAAGRRLLPVLVRRYERSDGRRGGTAKGLPILLVTVAGRRTGTLRTIPVVYLDHEGSYLVAASAGGMATEPQWFRNLRHAREATIRVGADLHTVTARIPTRRERDELWERVVLARAPFFARYQQKAARLIPVALLTPR